MEHEEAYPLHAIKYDVIVQEDGRIAVQVPFSPGKRVTVFIVQEHDVLEDFTDLVQASVSSTDFWDHPYDDEDWNDA